ncbi:MAG: cytochrome c oxidase subunit 3 family protein [Armatimonadetes bacterium]|nr:cytochrome c oxidase subunit 3 family protein [Armatimonadota bacterium]
MSDQTHPLYLGHHFEDIEQQNESYSVGMWAFLVTEIMFFGALFASYFIYRWMNQHEFHVLSHHLDWRLGFVNTLILLTSSLTMALGVKAAMRNDRRKQIGMILATIACGGGFLVVKYFEYTDKFKHGLAPGVNFSYPYADDGAPIAHMFYCIYFFMTGLHALHVVIGMIVMACLIAWIKKNPMKEQDFMPTEMTGLYWHFVDIVWIFLYPLLYLIPGK